MKENPDKQLIDCISRVLAELESENEIVLTSSTKNSIYMRIHNALKSIIPSTNLTASELQGIRSLLLEATSNEKFFNWEMPTLTGFTKEEFVEIAKKLPRG